MENIKFIKAYKRLNPEQKNAVDAIEGPVMVIAGPGTGKTQVLTMRIANIINKTDTPPEAILALTFTESAVASMRKRLADIIGTPAYKVAIMTFHGFANSIIKNYPDRFPEIISSSSIMEIDQIKIIKDIIDNSSFNALKPFGDNYYYLHSILSSINELKRQGISPEKFDEIARKEKKYFENIEDIYYESGAYKGKMKGKYAEDFKHIKRNEELAKIYEKYQQSLRNAKQYDYSDMIMYVMSALEKDDELRLVLQENYLYILVDEHQDTNSAQNRILELLANFYENPNLFVVGDEKQAIYHFQGASLENFRYFKKIFKGVSLISLRHNYRSTQTILDAAHNLLPQEISLISKAGHRESPINIADLSSPEVEYYFIAKKIKNLLNTGVEKEEIAVLYRENRDALPLARVIEKHNIPFNIESDQDVLRDEDIRKLLIIMKAIKNFGKAPQLFDLLHIDFFKIQPLDIYKLSLFSAKNRINAYDVIKSESELAEAGIESKKELVELYNKISQWKSNTKNKGAAIAFENIARDSGFLAYILNRPAAMEKIAKLHALFEHLKSLIENKKDYGLDDFFDYLDLVEEHNIMLKSSEITKIPGRIRLMTAHKSKGLEFEYVFIINAIDGKWGSRKRPEHIKLPVNIYTILQSVENKLSKDDDEKNLFYVALTRAKKEIYIAYSQRNRDGREQLPTQFIQEINENLLSNIKTEDYEKEFSSYREIEFAAAPQKQSEIQDKKFLNKIFKERGLSSTALGNYLECPWKYFYLNLIRIPEAPNKHLMYGNAVHEALKNYFDLFSKSENIGKNYLIKRFEESLARQPIEENEFYEALKKGKKSLSGYYDFYNKSWIPKTFNELKIDGIEIDSETTINGKLDKIEFLDAGNNINVVDYKTGKSKSRNAVAGNTKNDDGNYKRQLVFYNLLLNKGGKYNMVSGDIDFIEPDDKGKYHKERFEISKEEIYDLEKQIIQVSNEIRNLKFWNKFCAKPDCRYCALRKMYGKYT